MSEIIYEKSWVDFKRVGLLWWINRMLHLFGWTIVLEFDDYGDFDRAYPARCTFRGFSKSSEDIGFRDLTNYLHSEVSHLKASLDDSSDLNSFSATVTKAFLMLAEDGQSFLGFICAKCNTSRLTTYGVFGKDDDRVYAAECDHCNYPVVVTQGELA